MNNFGRLFRINIYGESHGQEVGILIDGCPAGLVLEEADFEKDLLRRKSGAKGTTPRLEQDKPVIKSGVFNGKTTGAPMLIVFENTNVRSKDYEAIKDTPRPGHADFTALKKFGGFNDYRGGGHFSGRLTLGLVTAGVVAKKLIHPVTVTAKLIEAGGDTDIQRAVDKAVEMKDSIGGIIECTALDVPPGLGEPFFDSAESVMSHMMFSIPAIKGIEFGAGFKAARMTGSEHNDLIIDINGKTETNHAGGINGGITNGNPLVFRVVVKPTSSISLPQDTVNMKTGKRVNLVIEGRHDVCIALRVPVVVENAAAIVLADLMLLEQKIPRVVE
ncbi:MAG: chorismate synthase [Candidatus Aminicenantes bacterium]|nr:chorismate synthase [Candidatus Aminicenantes bacterium]NIM83203.1 chorismate synthase [Candidatus Aminicenantes bacterium]NIN22589.1 chorismate synthase [Candidatus Aminicenantes bacterium]NIN46351.1 chorismate synthase [Candidatus Aminicenantes bacterium]NIN89199.1 chorismate synthase [Candidatus Aminicenantes bacterium]